MQLIIKFLLGYSMKIVIGGWGWGGGGEECTEGEFFSGGGRESKFSTSGNFPMPPAKKTLYVCKA